MVNWVLLVRASVADRLVLVRSIWGKRPVLNCHLKTGSCSCSESSLALFLQPGLCWRSPSPQGLSRLIQEAGQQGWAFVPYLLQKELMESLFSLFCLGNCPL